MQAPATSVHLLRLERRRPARAVLDVFIDQQGTVERAVMRESVHPIFDALVVDAARGWKYRPALKDGAAVRYLKTIAIVKQ